MDAIVLAGGEGTRLRPLTEQRPKGLAPILGRPLLGLLLDQLHRHGVERVVLALTRSSASAAIAEALGGDPTLGGTLMKDAPGLELLFAFEEAPLGSGGAIANAATLLGATSNPLLVCNGDLVTDLDVSAMLAAHRAQRAELTIALCEVAEPSRFGVAALDAAGRITTFVEKPAPGTEPSNLANAGFWLFSDSLIAAMDGRAFNRVEDVLFPELVSAGRAVFGWRHEGYWRDVGTPEAYREAVMDALDRGIQLDGAANWLDPSARVDAAATVRHSGIGARSSVQAGAAVLDSVLWEDVRVGAGARVTRSVLGAGFEVAAGAVIEDACLGSTLNARLTCGARLVTSIAFGTDGWRALIAEDFTFDNVRIVSQAFADYLLRADRASRGVVIGYDTRFLSGPFAAAVAEVLAANGIRVSLTSSHVPTPMLSFGVLERGVDAGVIVTASHNPARWNGFKVKMGNGASAPVEVTQAIEAGIPAVISGNRVLRMPLGEAESRGLVETFDPRPAFVAKMRELVDVQALRDAGYLVLVDSMYGAAAGLTAEIIGEGATRVQEIRGELNPGFPGIRAPEPITPNLGDSLALLATRKYAVGLSTDGDGDRFGLVDERGHFINQLQVFALLTRYLLDQRGERGALVRSVTTSRMVERLGQLFDCPVYETRVGFKYLGEKMMETDALIAGEESGGYAFRGHIPERDGILSGLYFLDAMVRSGRTPSELLSDLYAAVGRHEYDRIDVTLRPDENAAIEARVASADPRQIAGFPVVGRDTVDGFRFNLEGGWWLLLRFSGTEPLLRIYAEMPNAELVQDALQAGQEIAGVTL